MKKVKRWRYYCDFCGKGGGHAGYMRRHEAACTMNPNRCCNMCEYAGGGGDDLPDLIALVKKLISVQKFESEFGEYFKVEAEDGALDKLREAAECCPACMLAAIRQAGEGYWLDDFNFKKEKDAMFAAHNEEQQAMRGY